MDLHVQWGGRRLPLRAFPEGERYRLECEGREPLSFLVEVVNGSTLLLRIGDELIRARYVKRGRDLHLQIDGRNALLHLLAEEEEEELAEAVESPVVRAPMPGKVLELLVAVGDAVKNGDPVVRVEAMKMEVDLNAAMDGVVEIVHATAGDTIAPDDPLVTLREA